MVVNRVKTSFLAVLTIISFGSGFLMDCYFFKKEIMISYISQTELMELEKMRISKLDLVNRQLFLGKPEEAIKLIEKLQAERSTGSNIILVSEKAVYGKNVKSISKQVHIEILKVLEQEVRQDN